MAKKSFLKKLLAVILTAILTLAVTACGAVSSKPDNASENHQDNGIVYEQAATTEEERPQVQQESVRLVHSMQELEEAFLRGSQIILQFTYNTYQNGWDDDLIVTIYQLSQPRDDMHLLFNLAAHQGDNGNSYTQLWIINQSAQEALCRLDPALPAYTDKITLDMLKQTVPEMREELNKLI